MHGCRSREVWRVFDPSLGRARFGLGYTKSYGAGLLITAADKGSRSLR
jgi:hypothetical protein